MQDQFKKLITLKDDPMLCLFDELSELNQNIGKVIKTIEDSKVTEVAVTNQESVDFTSLETGLTELKESIDNIVIPEIKGVDLSGVETLLKKISEKKEDKIDLSILSELKNIATILDGILFAYQNMCQMKMPEMKEVDMTPLTEILTLINDNIVAIEVPEFDYERIVEAIGKIKISVGGTSVAKVEAQQTNGSQKTQIVDGDGNVAVVDLINKAQVYMDWEHHAIHEGIAFNLNVYSTVAFGTPKYCQFKTGSKYVHLKEKTIVDGSDTLLCQFIEAPTVTDGTTLVPTYNRNRNSSTTSVMVIYSDPTNISGGTILEYDYIFGADNALGGAQVSSPGAFMNLEWVLKPNTTYIYKLENLGDGTATFLSKLMWYEH